MWLQSLFRRYRATLEGPVRAEDRGDRSVDPQALDPASAPTTGSGAEHPPPGPVVERVPLSLEFDRFSVADPEGGGGRHDGARRLGCRVRGCGSGEDQGEDEQQNGSVHSVQFYDSSSPRSTRARTAERLSLQGAELGHGRGPPLRPPRRAQRYRATAPRWSPRPSSARPSGSSSSSRRA